MWLKKVLFALHRLREELFKANGLIISTTENFSWRRMLPHTLECIVNEENHLFLFISQGMLKWKSRN
jgi:hypothetical protein